MRDCTRQCRLERSTILRCASNGCPLAASLCCRHSVHLSTLQRRPKQRAMRGNQSQPSRCVSLCQASAAASAAGKTPATSRAARARDGRRSRRAGRHPSGAPGHSMECGSSVLMSPDGTFCPSRCQCPQRVPYLHQHCMLSMIVKYLHAAALV